MHRPPLWLLLLLHIPLQLWPHLRALYQHLPHQPPYYSHSRPGTHSAHTLPLPPPPQGLPREGLKAAVKSYADQMGNLRHLLADLTLPLLSVFSGSGLDSALHRLFSQVGSAAGRAQCATWPLPACCCAWLPCLLAPPYPHRHPPHGFPESKLAVQCNPCCARCSTTRPHHPTFLAHTPRPSHPCRAPCA
jgi:hypothetical protein